MRRLLLVLPVSCFCLLAAGVGEDSGDAQREVVVLLRDGSQIVGELLRLEQGQYHIKTESLGVVMVGSKVIRSIVFDKATGEDAAGSTAGTAESASTAQQRSPATHTDAATAVFGFDAILKAMTSNSAIMGKVERLKEDPDVKAVLEDAGIMQALEDGNFGALLDNQKIRALLENDVVKSISKEYQKDAE